MSDKGQKKAEEQGQKNADQAQKNVDKGQKKAEEQGQKNADQAQKNVDKATQ